MKIKLTIFLIAFILLFSFSNFSQTGNNAILRGTLLKSNGKPQSYTEIELVPVGSTKIVIDPKLMAISSISGKFTFFDVPDGKYTLSINFDDKPSDIAPYTTFYFPNTKKRTEAEIFEVKSRSLLKIVTFQLPPPLLQIKITGKVINKEGKPVPDVYVNLQDSIFDQGFSFNKKTNKLGTFIFNGFENRIYRIVGILLEKPLKYYEEPIPIGFAQSDVFILTPNTSEIILTLKETEDLQKKQNRTIGKLILESKIW
ncbi:MAG: carboxypeptidase-like regulatory domain-containing protein [Pyrinomonadaceae bacterium]|nr:carboxypeptidase-like regulatory domain-containing protein [Pyrinomonadaceae bacterium]